MKHPWLAFAPAVLVAIACASSDPKPLDGAEPGPASEPETPVESTAAEESPAPELDPETVKRVQLELNVAGQLLRQARFDEAFEAASAAVAITPDRVEPYEVLSNWYVQLERHDLAIETFERFSADSAHGLRFLARHQALSDDRQTALATLERCIEKDVRHPGCRFERALLRQMNGAFEGAVDDLRVAYEVDSDPVTAVRLAEMLRVTGAYAEIVTVVETALEGAPDSTDLLLARARLQLRDRDDVAAEQTLRRTLELDPTSYAASRLLGGMLLRLGQELEGRYRLARADLYRDYHKTSRRLIQDIAANRDATAALMIAELDLTIGNYQGAQRWLEMARAEGAAAQRLAAAQAWTWFALGDMPKGDAALARAGGDDNGRANLARAARAVRSGNTELAVTWLQRAIVNGPNERNFLHRAADLYATMGDQDSAEALLIRAATAGFP